MAQGNLIWTEFIWGGSQWFSKPFENLAYNSRWEIILPKDFCNSLEAKTGSGYIFTWNLGEIKDLDVSLQSILCFLIPHNHALDDALQGMCLCVNGLLVPGDSVVKHELSSANSNPRDILPICVTQ